MPLLFLCNQNLEEFTFFDDAKQTQTSRSPCAQTQETSEEVPRCSQTQESGPTQTLSNDRKHVVQAFKKSLRFLTMPSKRRQAAQRPVRRRRRPQKKSLAARRRKRVVRRRR
ncbi:hypothetical protein NQZ68_019468 [Dissostichus eleginoides]|nr:hypothetical protein NQZ68_019468 [Dissostichus eleginoides]